MTTHDIDSPLTKFFNWKRRPENRTQILLKIEGKQKKRKEKKKGIYVEKILSTTSNQLLFVHLLNTSMGMDEK